ncbi:MAG: hypothetical protein M0P73_07765 [Syntrophobacterales bacterium]|nr:hypothetical protein [Syntrophobacterales bacterium]
MENLKLGEIIALVGLVVLLVTGAGRRRVRQGKLPAKQNLVKWLFLRGDIVAFGLILAGLVLMYLRK